MLSNTNHPAALLLEIFPFCASKTRVILEISELKPPREIILIAKTLEGATTPGGTRRETRGVYGGSTKI